jgi:Bacterial TSP3 repeat
MKHLSILLCGLVLSLPQPLFGQVPTEQVSPVVAPLAGGAGFTMTWPGITGRVYFIQISTDRLKTWNYAPAVEFGTGVPICWGCASAGTGSFARLKYTTATDYEAGASGDLDGDGITNSSEIPLGTDPFNVDTDSDGLPDGWEVGYGLNPLVPTPVGLDSDGDGLTNLQEFQFGASPTATDTDGDGISDALEASSGSRPGIFDLPALTLEYSWREATGEDIRVHDAFTVRTLTGKAANGTTTRPWSIPPPASAVNASDALHQIMGTNLGGTELPWSAWIPWTGSATARFRNSVVGDSSYPFPYPVIRHQFHRREVRIRLRAARAMPVPWTVNLQKTLSTASGKPGTGWASTSVLPVPVVLSLAVGQQEVTTTLLPSTEPGASAPAVTASTNEGLVETTLISTGTTGGPTAFDGDGDTLTSQIEGQIGTNPSLADSDGDGIGDSDAQVSGVDSIKVSLIHQRKSLIYHGEPSYATLSFASTGVTPVNQGTVLAGYTALNAKLNNVAFNNTPPTGLPESRCTGGVEATGASVTAKPPGASDRYLHGYLQHRRVRAVLSQSPVAATSRVFIKTKRRTIGSVSEVVTAEVVTLHFAAGQVISTDSTDLDPQFTDPTAGETVSMKLEAVQLSLRVSGKIEPAPENSAYNHLVFAFQGDDLGPLPMGKGRVDQPNLSYTAPVGVVAQLPDLTNVHWRWKRYLTYRSWFAVQDTRKNRWIVQQRRAQLGTLAAPLNDDDTGLGVDEIASNLGRIYIHDNSGLGPNQSVIPTGTAPLLMGDYVYEHKQFTYKVETDLGGTWQEVASMDLGQRMIARRVGMSGVSTTDFVGLENSNRLRVLPLVTNGTDIRSIVGGTQPIIFAPSAN